MRKHVIKQSTDNIVGNIFQHFDGDEFCQDQVVIDIMNKIFLRKIKANPDMLRSQKEHMRFQGPTIARAKF